MRPLALLLPVLALALLPATAGATGWVTSEPLSPAGKVAVDQTIAVTPSGERILTWRQESTFGVPEGIGIRIAPPNGSFAPQQTIAAPDAHRVTLATGNDDNAALTWTVQDSSLLHVARRVAGSDRFVEVTPIDVTGIASEPRIVIQGGNVTVAVSTFFVLNNRVTTTVRAFELPAGATALREVNGAGLNGTLDSVTYLSGTDPSIQLHQPELTIGAGAVHAIWQERHAATATVPHGTVILKHATRDAAGGVFAVPGPIAAVDIGNRFEDIPVALVGAGNHVVAGWARPDAIAFQDIAAGGPVRTIPSTNGFRLQAGVDLAGAITVGWQRFNEADFSAQALLATAAPGAAPGQPRQITPPNNFGQLDDLVVAPNGTTLALPARYTDLADNNTVQIRALFGPSATGLGVAEDVTGVHDRASFGEDIHGVGALGAARQFVAWAADDDLGLSAVRVYVSERDVAPPAFDAISIPATTTAGTRIALAASATDALSPVNITWDFGDGSHARGATASHAYGAPGNYTVTVSAEDASANVAVQKRTVAVAAAPSRGGAGAIPTTPADTPPPPPDRTPPVVSALKSANAKFRVGSGSTALIGAAAKSPAGTVFNLNVSERSTLILSFTGKVAGRKSGRRCIAGRTKGRACTIAVEPGVLLRDARAAGPVSIPFNGKIGATRLAPGTYKVAVSAIDAAGNRSRQATATFTVVAR